MKSSLALAAGFVFAAALLLMAPSTAKATTPPTRGTVTIVNDAFTPAVVHVRVGDKVTFVNGDDETHTFTSDAAIFDSGHVDAKKRYAYTFATPGSYPYHCTIHTFMKGTVIVDPAEAKK